MGNVTTKNYTKILTDASVKVVEKTINTKEFKMSAKTDTTISGVCSVAGRVTSINNALLNVNSVCNREQLYKFADKIANTLVENIENENSSLLKLWGDTAVDAKRNITTDMKREIERTDLEELKVDVETITKTTISDSMMIFYDMAFTNENRMVAEMITSQKFFIDSIVDVANKLDISTSNKEKSALVLVGLIALGIFALFVVFSIAVPVMVATGTAKGVVKFLWWFRCRKVWPGNSSNDDNKNDRVTGVEFVARRSEKSHDRDMKVQQQLTDLSKKQTKRSKEIATTIEKRRKETFQTRIAMDDQQRVQNSWKPLTKKERVARRDAFERNPKMLRYYAQQNMNAGRPDPNDPLLWRGEYPIQSPELERRGPPPRTAESSRPTTRNVAVDVTTASGKADRELLFGARSKRGYKEYGAEVKMGRNVAAGGDPADVMARRGSPTPGTSSGIRFGDTRSSSAYRPTLKPWTAD